MTCCHLFLSQDATFSDEGSLQLKLQEHFNQVFFYDVISVSSASCRYKSGRVGPYSLDLGHQIKQRLWERLNQSTMMTSVSEDGLLTVDVSYGAGVHPPLYDVETSREPKHLKNG